MIAGSAGSERARSGAKDITPRQPAVSDIEANSTYVSGDDHAIVAQHSVTGGTLSAVFSRKWRASSKLIKDFYWANQAEFDYRSLIDNGKRGGAANLDRA